MLVWASVWPSTACPLRQAPATSTWVSKYYCPRKALACPRKSSFLPSSLLSPRLPASSPIQPRVSISARQSHPPRRSCNRHPCRPSRNPSLRRTSSASAPTTAWASPTTCSVPRKPRPTAPSKAALINLPSVSRPERQAPPASKRPSPAHKPPTPAQAEPTAKPVATPKNNPRPASSHSKRRKKRLASPNPHKPHRRRRLPRRPNLPHCRRHPKKSPQSSHPLRCQLRHRVRQARR